MTDAEGRAGQEAARLLTAAQEWLRTSAPHLAPVDEDGETCPCPLCRAVAGVREADPDAVGRWVDAAVEGLSAALAQVGSPSSEATERDDSVSTESPDAGSPSAQDGADPDPVGHDGPSARVRRIRLDGGVGPDVP